MMKALILGAGLTLAIAAPALAQSYTAGEGSGNLVNAPLAEKTDGAYGFGGGIAPARGDASSASQRAQGGNNGSSAFAFSPEGAGAPKHGQVKQHHSQNQ